MKKTLTLMLICLAFAASAQKGQYTLILKNVEVSGKTAADSTSIKIDSIIPFMPRYIYEDNDVKFNWTYGYNDIDFELLNKTQETIKVNWDDAAYIDIDGTTGKVMHNGVKYIDRGNSLPSSSIIKGAKLSDLVAPTSKVYYSSGTYGGWRQLPLIDGGKKAPSLMFDNKEVRVLLPILIGGTVKEYIFTFKTKWIEEVKKKKRG